MNVFKKDQVYEQLREAILSGRYSEGEKLLPEKEFARQLAIGKITLRNALSRLESERLLTRVRGQGTFVSYRAEEVALRSIVLVCNDDSAYTPSALSLNLRAEFHLQAMELRLNELYMTVEQLSKTKPEELADFARKAKVIGFFLFMHGFTGNEPWLKLLRDSVYPLILTNALLRDYELTLCAAVTIQMADALQQAIRLLADRGYRRIGVIHPISPYSGILLSMNARQIIKECAVHGMTCRPEQIRPCENNRFAISGILEEWLESPQAPDAIIIGLGDAALFACEILKKYQLRIGEDIGIIVYCSQDNTLAVNGITTISQDLSGITRKAFQLLLEADKWYPPSTENPPPNRYHYFRLNKRNSIRSNLP